MLNYYVTKNPFEASYEFFLTSFALFDNYSDIYYIVNTKFYDEFSLWVCIFMVALPPFTYFVLSLRELENPKYALSIFIMNCVQHNHSLGPDKDVEKTMAISKLIFALMEDIP